MRDEWPLGLILLDGDYFKLYNDTYGHQKGDWCLQQVASVLKKVAHRAGDLPARYGGEEFALILPNTELQGIEYLARLINKFVQELNIPHQASKVASIVTVSVGYSVSFWDSRFTAEDLIHAADAALYQAKAQGRNQTQYRSLE